MTLNINILAKEINKAIAAIDKDGLSQPVTPEQKVYAKAIINTLKAALVNHLPGTVKGITAPGSPLVDGEAQNGIIINVLAPTWLGIMITGIPTANPVNLSLEAIGSTTYIMGAGKVNFAKGQITGQCTSTSNNPGPLVNGQGQKGTLDQLDGSAWAKIVMPPLGNPVLAQKIYTAIVKYLNKNAEITYFPGTVTGTCPAGGGPLENGTGTGGIIN